MNIDYSFIIPHRNSIQLLYRCVQSIPVLEYVEVIIIDDKSNDITIQQLQEFSNSRKNLIVLYQDSNLGAGAARNRGVQSASGRWLIFADCDDFFNLSLTENLIKYRNNATIDIIYFNTNSVDSTNLKEIKSRGATYNKWIQNSIKKDCIDPKIRYRINPPWGKFVNRDFVLENNIWFDEVFAANDVTFSVKIGHFANKILLCLDCIYCATDCPNSIQKTTTLKHQNSRLKVVFDNYTFLKSVHKEKYRMNIWKVILRFYRVKGRKSIMYYVATAFKNIDFKYLLIDLIKMPFLIANFIFKIK